MPEYIDVLTNSANPQFLTVDIATLPDVPINPAGAFPDGLLANAFNESKISPKDHFRLLSMGVILPFQLGLSSVMLNVNFSWRDSLGNIGYFTVGSFIGSMRIPMENYELALDSFQQYPALALGTYIQLKLNAVANVSMVGVPAALDTLVLPVISFIKIQHTLPLTV